MERASARRVARNKGKKNRTRWIPGVRCDSIEGDPAALDSTFLVDAAKQFQELNWLNYLFIIAYLDHLEMITFGATP